MAATGFWDISAAADPPGCTEDAPGDDAATRLDDEAAGALIADVAATDEFIGTPALEPAAGSAVDDPEAGPPLVSDCGVPSFTTNSNS